MNARLEKLKKTLVLEWGEIAKHLGVTRSMLDKVRKGERQAGPQLERRIIEAEIEAGLSDAKSPTVGLLREPRVNYDLQKSSLVVDSKPPTDGKVTLDDFQRLEKMLADFAVEFSAELAKLKKKMEGGS